MSYSTIKSYHNYNSHQKHCSRRHHQYYRFNYCPVIIIQCCIFIVLFINQCTISAARANVCKTLEDYSFFKTKRNCWFEPNVWSTTPYMVARSGYQAEMHVVTTEDGYLLTMFRIPYKKNIMYKEKRSRKRPLLLAHGISVSSDNFVDRGPNSIAYSLSDADYDVWLPNFRGNFYSEEHMTKSTVDADFWDFSFHEIGIYDLPAVVDYIRNYTEYDEIFYVGNSMGATIVYVFLSERPEYNKYIKAMTTISPVVHMGHIRNIVETISKWYLPIQKGLEFFGVAKFVPMIEVNRMFFFYVCTSSKYGLLLCQYLIGLLFGYSYDHVEPFVFPVLLSRTPSGSSLRNFGHYAQILQNEGTFRQYDYGEDMNKKIYGTLHPPVYDLSKINTNNFIIYSHNDLLSPQEDNEILRDNLNCNVTLLDVEREDYNHMDYIYAIDAHKTVYDPIINYFKQFTLNRNKN